MTDPTHRAPRRGRLKFLALVALFTAPVLVAGGWYFMADIVRPASGSHGTLLDPVRPLSEFRVATLGDDDYDLEALRGHWTLVHVIDGHCGDSCRQRIHYTRQIRDALGHDRVRVRRLAIVADSAATIGLAGLLPEHPDLTVVRAEPDLAEQFPPARGSTTVFLVDPLGNLVMRFDADVDAQGIRKDLERLLRVSRIG